MRNHAEGGYTSEDMDGRPYPENEHIGFLQQNSRKSHPTDRRCALVVFLSYFDSSDRFQ